MKLIKKNIINYDNFEVLDEDNNAITGLITGDFTIKLYNPSGTEISSSVTVSIIELENGLYRVSFTPNVTGNWLLVIYHSTYFPYGKANDYECVDALFDDLQLILGLVQHNFRIFSPTYDGERLTSATIKIYPTASDVDSDTNVIATYSLTASYNASGLISAYKMVKN